MANAKLDAYVQAFINPAMASEKKTGIPHLFALGQSALETGYASEKPGNAMFGTKANKSWAGAKQLLKTTEVLSYGDVDTARAHGISFPAVISIVPNAKPGKFTWTVRDYFRAYPSTEASFDDWAHMITTQKNFAPALKYKNDPYAFADFIAKAGYATALNYAAEIKELMREIAEKKKLLNELPSAAAGLSQPSA